MFVSYLVLTKKVNESMNPFQIFRIILVQLSKLKLEYLKKFQTKVQTPVHGSSNREMMFKEIISKRCSEYLCSQNLSYLISIFGKLTPSTLIVLK